MPSAMTLGKWYDVYLDEYLKGNLMPIHADDAEKLYLQSKKKRLTEALSRIDAELKDVLSKGYTSLRTRRSSYYNEHPNNDIYKDIVKYYTDLGWTVKDEGHGYMVIAPDKSRKPKPVQVVDPSGSFSLSSKDWWQSPQYQTSSLMSDLNAQLGPQKESSFIMKPNPPEIRVVPPRTDFWATAWDKVSLPFAVFWAWFKEVMK